VLRRLQPDVVSGQRRSEPQQHQRQCPTSRLQRRQRQCPTSALGRNVIDDESYRKALQDAKLQ
jgi:hypothetical protein